jgi:hypothetical protein
MVSSGFQTLIPMIEIRLIIFVLNAEPGPGSRRASFRLDLALLLFRRFCRGLFWLCGPRSIARLSVLSREPRVRQGSTELDPSAGEEALPNHTRLTNPPEPKSDKGQHEPRSMSSRHSNHSAEHISPAESPDCPVSCDQSSAP